MTSEVRVLCLGSVRVNTEPEPEHAVKAGFRVEFELRDRGLSFDDFDAAVHTGVVPPAPEHHTGGPGAHASFLATQLGRVADEIPLLYVPGDHDGTVGTRRIYSRRYGSLDDGLPAYDDLPDGFRRVPLDGTVEVGGVPFTANPRLVEGTTVLVRGSFDPGLWETFDGALYLAGGEYVGRRAGDLLVPPFLLHDLGPGRPDREGAYNDLRISTDGTYDADLHTLDGTSVTRCDRHADRGHVVTLPGMGCPFCRAPDRYLAERLRAVAARRRAAGERARISDCVGDLAPALTEADRDGLGDFAATQVLAERIYPDLHRPDGAVPDLPDPARDGFRPFHYASERLGLTPADRRAYFARHGVTHPEEFPEDPRAADEQLPDTSDHGVLEFDRQALRTRITQGEWLAFCGASELAPAWERAVELVSEGTLYDARASTAWGVAARDSSWHALFVLAPNYFDTDDVRRIADEMDADPRLPDRTLGFKPHIYSKAGIHGDNKGRFGLPSAVRYTPEDVGSSLRGSGHRRVDD